VAKESALRLLKSSRRELPEKDTRDRLKWEKEQRE
jgi:hypothetical protein